MPGSPPRRMAEPGTTPPPRTRSNSEMVVGMRGISSGGTSANGDGVEVGVGVEESRRRPGIGWRRGRRRWRRRRGLLRRRGRWGGGGLRWRWPFLRGSPRRCIRGICRAIWGAWLRSCGRGRRFWIWFWPWVVHPNVLRTDCSGEIRNSNDWYLGGLARSFFTTEAQRHRGSQRVAHGLITKTRRGHEVTTKNGGLRIGH